MRGQSSTLEAAVCSIHDGGNVMLNDLYGIIFRSCWVKALEVGVLLVTTV